MPGTDYVSAINVHICRNGVPGRAGGYVPGMSAAYENQALRSEPYTYKNELGPLFVSCECLGKLIPEKINKSFITKSRVHSS